MELKDFFGFAFGIAAILSTLLIFVISWWLVLIMNIVEIVILFVFFGEDGKISWWVFFTEAVLCVGVMILVMCFPEKVHGGLMSRISDHKSIADIAKDLGLSNKNATVAEIYKRFRTLVGIGLTVFIVGLIIVGIIFRYKNAKGNVEYYSFYLAAPLMYMGGLILLNCLSPIMKSMMFGICYGSMATLIAICGLLHIDIDDIGGSSGGGGKSYTVYIVED